MNSHKVWILIALCSMYVLSSCSPSRNSYLERLRQFESEPYAGQEVPSEQIEVLRTEIARLEQYVQEYVRTTRELGTFYKMVASDFFDAGSFLPALENFERAMEIHGDSHVLPYYAALSALQLAKISTDPDQRQQYYERGESHYLRALSLRSNHDRSLYGISILYLYELDQPEKALDYITRFIEVRRSDIRGRFVLGAAQAAIGDIDGAIQTYRWILNNSNDAEEQQNARANLDVLIGGNF